MMDELKACPFCGSSNTTLDYYEISCPQELGTIVVCNDCGASAKSIVDWNTRPIEDALNARIAELETKIRHNALWQASEDAEERAHLEKLVPDLKKRIAELEADNAEFRQLIRDWSIVLEQDNGFQLWHVESVRQAMLETDKERGAESERFTVHSNIERQDDKSPNDTQTQTIVYGKENEG